MKSETKIHTVPDRSLVFEQQLEKLNESNISNVNKQFIKNFQSYKLSTGRTKTYRVGKLTCQLRNLALWFKIDFNLATKQDIMNLVVSINTEKSLSQRTKSGLCYSKAPYSPATRADYRRCLKEFYKWFKKEDPRLDSEDRLTRSLAQKIYAFLEEDVSISYDHKQIDPTSILTEENINDVLTKGCRTPKEKAFISFLHETGMRAGEILGLKLKDISIRKNMGSASCDGKTGRRTVQFTKSMAYMVQWLNLHPHKDSPESYLWLGESSNRMHAPLIYRGAQKVIIRCFERAGIKKRNNLHWFRHSRASLLAPHLPEVLLCQYMGWVIGSKQTKTYVHLCPQQLENAFLKMNGFESEDEKKNQPQKCGCGMVNDGFVRYCGGCGNPLSVVVAMQDQETIKEETNDTLKEMMVILQKPEMMRAFLEFKLKMKS